MRRQAVRTIALMLTVLVGFAAPARAATITFADVVRSVGADGQLRPASEVRLRVGSQQVAVSQAVSQQGTTQTASTSTTQQPNGATQQVGQQGSAATTVTPGSTDPSLSQSGGNVQTVDLGDVTGTVCDCGEIPRVVLPKGGISWWPFLAGIPLVCVTGICTSNNTPPETPVPTPTPPTPPSVPEPATLLLFGSGLLALGAGARRRRARKQGEDVVLAATAEEV